MPRDTPTEHLRWTLDAEPGPDWPDLVHRFGGTVFHSPPALTVALPPGEAVFCRLKKGSDVLGIVVGMRHGCRLGRGLTHARFASLPVTAEGVDRGEALGTLADALGREGCAEAVFYSFGAPNLLTEVEGSRPTRERLEFIVDLTEDEDNLFGRIKKKDRSAIRKGTRSGWEVRSLDGDAAAKSLFDVQTNAASRGAERGAGYDVSRIERDTIAALDDLSAVHGLQVLGAFSGQKLLAAVLIGWGGGQAYYIKGGSTPDGYRVSAARWLHWQVMTMLKQRGLSVYNLGGTPGDCDDPEHPLHGLYKYKTSFGAGVRPCRGARFALRPVHLGLHAALGWLSR